MICPQASNPGDVFVRSSLLLGDYFEFPALARDTYILKAVAGITAGGLIGYYER